MMGGITRIGAGRNARVTAVSVTACNINNKCVTVYYNTHIRRRVPYNASGNILHVNLPHGTNKILMDGDTKNF